MSITRKNRSDKLIVFTRYPVPGKTKTRLIPALGPAGAADVHRKLTENIITEIETIKKREETDIEVCFTDGSIDQMKGWLGNRLSYVEQEQGDLGSRMYSAIKMSLETGSKKVVLIGTDIPVPVSDLIEKAFYTLDDNDIVIGPAMDGGYWLVGMKHPCNIFDGISWGTESVLSQTLKVAEDKKFSVSLLDPVNDIDTVDDLLKLDPHGFSWVWSL